MLKNITLSNKALVPTIEDVGSTSLSIYNSQVGPIRIYSRKYSVHPIVGHNDLILTMDNKDYIATDVKALFSSGSTSVKFDIKDPIEVPGIESYDVPVQENTNTLEIGSADPTRSIEFKVVDGQIQDVVVGREIDMSAPLRGYELGPIKLNGLEVPSIESIELYTEDTILKAKLVFAVDHIRFSGINVDTTITESNPITD